MAGKMEYIKVIRARVNVLCYDAMKLSRRLIMGHYRRAKMTVNHIIWHALVAMIVHPHHLPQNVPE